MQEKVKMVTTDVELQLALQLKEAGKLLSDPPSSDDDLLHILDQTEKLLSKVDQSPNIMMIAALRPSMEALVTRSLLRHSNVDVKISVAACISEITRITAPDAPYDDEEMKDVFRLIVSSLENLSDTTSRSYEKKSSIIETLYKVRSCVILLDLECDVLIVEMFEHFLKSVRDHHLGNNSIFSWMVNIMVLVLEESEDISIYMLKPLLASIKNNTEGVLPVARQLGEAVLQKSADKLRPHLIETLRILGDSLDNYSPVLASICEGTTDVVEHNDENASVQRQISENKLAKVSSNVAPQADESKLTTASSDNAAQAVRGNSDVTLLGEADATSNRSLKLVTGNGIMVTGNEEGSADKESSKKLDKANDHPDSNLTSKVDTDTNSVQTSNKRGKKSNTTLKLSKSSDSSHGHGNEAEKLANNERNSSKNVPLEIEKKTDDPVSVPKAIESSVANAPSESISLPDESLVKTDDLSNKQILPQKVKVSLPYKRRKKSVWSKKKSLGRDNASSMDIVPMEPVLAKAPEGMSDSDMKSPKRGRKKATIAMEDKNPPIVTTLEDGKATSGPDVELLGTSSKKVDTVDSDPTPLKKRGAKKTVAKGSVAKKSKKTDGGDSEAKKPKEGGKSMDAADPEGELSKPSVINEDGSDSDSKPLIQSAKNGRKRKIVSKLSGDTANEEEGGDSDGKPIKSSAKKGNTSGSASVKSLSKNKQGKKRGNGKSVEEKDQEKPLSEEDDGMDITLQSALKTVTGEGNLEAALTNTSKRKRSISKKAAETIKYDDSLVGLKVKVWWPDDKVFYDGVIESFDSDTKMHKVLYEDDEEEILNLKDEKWEIVHGVSAHKEEKAAEVQNTDDLPETPKKKKSRIDSGPSDSEEKLKVSAKRAGGARGRLAKSAGSAKGVGKPKSTTMKSKSQKSSGKSVKAAADSKDAGMSEDDDVETPEIVNKNKQGNRKTVKKSVVKTPQSGKKVDADVKESEDVDEDAAETPETAKEKPAEILKAATATKSRRKRTKRT